MKKRRKEYKNDLVKRATHLSVLPADEAGSVIKEKLLSHMHTHADTHTRRHTHTHTLLTDLVEFTEEDPLRKHRGQKHFQQSIPLCLSLSS